MKILEIIPNLNVGGAESFVVNLSNEFERQGHECKVVTLYDAYSTKLLDERISGGLERGSLGKKRGFDVKCVFNLLHEIKRDRPHVVHAHIGAISYLILAAVFYRKCRYYATIHSEARRESGGKLTRLIRRFLFNFRLVTPVAISEESLASFTSLYGKMPELVYNGVPLPSGCDYVDYKASVFVHAASCQPVKNQKLLLEAFSRIVSRYPDVQLHWYGDNSQYIKLFGELSHYFNDNIIYKGVTQDIRKYLANARACCLSSNMEGMPMTIIEAMSVGCIPISTPVGGCVNMIETGKNGFLSSDMSIESLVSTIEIVLQLGKDELAEIKTAARKSFEENYTIEKCAKAYLNLFNR